MAEINDVCEVLTELHEYYLWDHRIGLIGFTKQKFEQSLFDLEFQGLDRQKLDQLMKRALHKSGRIEVYKRIEKARNRGVKILLSWELFRTYLELLVQKITTHNFQSCSKTIALLVRFFDAISDVPREQLNSGDSLRGLEKKLNLFFDKVGLEPEYDPETDRKLFKGESYRFVGPHIKQVFDNLFLGPNKIDVIDFKSKLKWISKNLTFPRLLALWTFSLNASEEYSFEEILDFQIPDSEDVERSTRKAFVRGNPKERLFWEVSQKKRNYSDFLKVKIEELWGVNFPSDAQQKLICDWIAVEWTRLLMQKLDKVMKNLKIVDEKDVILLERKLQQTLRVHGPSLSLTKNAAGNYTCVVRRT